MGSCKSGLEESMLDVLRQYMAGDIGLKLAQGPPVELVCSSRVRWDDLAVSSVLWLVKV
jgi:hypothetical protein